MNCETNDCRKEKRGCKGCFFDEGTEITADEMFEELGYKKSEHKNCIRYRNEDYEIIFWRINELKVEVYDSITMQELKAINKKVEELGWKI